MTSGQISNAYAANYPALAANLPGQENLWLQVFRNAGLQRFSQQGFPGVNEEDWRYTNLAALNKTVFVPSESQTVDAEWLTAYLLPNTWRLVLLNGRFSETLSDLRGIPAEVTVSSLAEILQAKPAVVADLLGKAVDCWEHSLVAFNDAWFADGVVIDVPAGVRLQQPIQILHVVTAQEALAATRNILSLHENAQAEVIETFLGSAESYFTAAVSECFLADKADLSWCKIQLEAEKANHFGGCYVKQADNSHFAHHNFALGGSVARSDIHTDLHTAAECSLNGLFLGNKRQHIDNHTRINHLKPQGVSREFYKGVLNDKARGVFQGRVVVAEAAQKTDSQMNNRNLLLSADAEVNTKPQLEIYADDVKCSHGVTVGQLEEKSVFYLQSRGLDETSARDILTFAFANEMVDKLENPAVKGLLRKQLLQHFPAINLESHQ